VVVRLAPKERPIAVVVENEMHARPQSGLGDADVIYEAVAEFNLTRFVAVFADATAEKVGPTRSARAYHAAIAAEYDAGLAHCLEVPSVPAVVAATRIANLDGCRMASPRGFSRDSTRKAPHNLYVSVPALREAASGIGSYGGFASRADWPAATERVDHFSFIYPEDHLVEWRYDDSRRVYLRSQDGAPHVDISNRQISASAVIVQLVAVQHSSYYGEAGYHEITLVGEGDAIVYANGGKREGQWRRASLVEPTRFFDRLQKEIMMPPGRVFVQLVGMGTPIEEGR
jgi:hypothetical protein